VTLPISLNLECNEFTGRGCITAHWGRGHRVLRTVLKYSNTYYCNSTVLVKQQTAATRAVQIIYLLVGKHSKQSTGTSRNNNSNTVNRIELNESIKSIEASHCNLLACPS
jgi:hypothetical protein